MAYCTADEVRGMIKDDALNTLIGDAYIEEPERREELLRPIVTEAVEDASGEIDGYLTKRYSLPLFGPPKILNKFAKDIAVYNLISRAGIDEGERENNYLTRYKNAIAFLTKVAKGETDIVKEGTDPSKAAAEGFRISSSPRLFSRATMRGL